MCNVRKIAWKLSATGQSMQVCDWNAANVHLFELRYATAAGESKSLSFYANGSPTQWRTTADQVFDAMQHAFEAGQQASLVEDAA